MEISGNMAKPPVIFTAYHPFCHIIRSRDFNMNLFLKSSDNSLKTAPKAVFPYVNSSPEFLENCLTIPPYKVTLLL